MESPSLGDSDRQGSAHRIGLIADTHGLFDPKLEELLAGVELILHAGDVGAPEVLRILTRIAPVKAVSGNVDVGVAGLDLPCFVRQDVHGVPVLVTHYVGDPEALLPPVAAELAREPARLVLSGHTHKPWIECRDETVFVNPGSCGPRRFKLPRSCGVLTLPGGGGSPETGGLDIQLFDLDSGGDLDWKSA